MINLFVLSGNMGGDIDVRFTPNGKCIGTFSLPCKSGWGDNEKTAWIRCKLIGDRAEKLAPYLLKGSKVTVHGRFELDEWEKDGVKHSIPCVVINDLDLPPKPDAAPSFQPTQQAAKPVQKPVQQPVSKQAEPAIDFDDDIPF